MLQTFMHVTIYKHIGNLR